MRILHVSCGNLFGGIESMLVTLARHRHECSAIEPEVALAFEGRLSQELRNAGVAVHILGAARASRPHSVLRARRRLGQLLREGRFDVAICHAAWPHAMFGRTIRSAGVPLVFWAHARVERLHWLERWASLTSPSLMICNSQFTAAGLTSLFATCKREVLHCAVASTSVIDDAERGRIRQDLGVPSSATLILQVSRVERGKGHTTLVAALATLLDRTDWVACFVGYPQTPAEHSYRDEIRDMARNLGVLERVRFYESPQNVQRLYGAADLFCQPNSTPDSFGITLVEAMLAGLPVVTSDLGGPREFIDESCGVTVEAGNAQAVAGALRRLRMTSHSGDRWGMQVGNGRVNGSGPVSSSSAWRPSCRGYVGQVYRQAGRTFK